MKASHSGEKRRPNNDELWGQLTNAIHLRSSEDQVLWTISGIFWAANVLLLVVLFQGGKFPESPIPGLVASGVGVTLSLIQFFLQGRALGHIKRYEALMKRLEESLDFHFGYAVSADLNASEADKYLGGRKGNVWRKVRMGTLVRARMLMQGTSLGAALLWAAAFAFFLYRAF